MYIISFIDIHSKSSWKSLTTYVLNCVGLTTVKILCLYCGFNFRIVGAVILSESFFKIGRRSAALVTSSSSSIFTPGVVSRIKGASLHTLPQASPPPRIGTSAVSVTGTEADAEEEEAAAIAFDDCNDARSWATSVLLVGSCAALGPAAVLVLPAPDRFLVGGCCASCCAASCCC